MTSAAHFIFIPVVLLIGVVIGWMLGLARGAGRVRRGAEAARARSDRRRVEAALRAVDHGRASTQGRAIAR